MLLITIALLGGVLLLADPAFADAPADPGPVSTCKDYAGLTNRIVSCVRDTLSHAMAAYFDPDTGFYRLVKRAIAGFLTLGVAIYGTMAAFGMLEKVGRDTFVLILKICFITWCCTNVDTLYNLTLDAMDASGEAVVMFAPDPNSATSGAGSEGAVCMHNMKEASADKDRSYSAPWLAMDCMIDSVIGIKIPESTGGTPTKGAVGKWWNDNLDSGNRGMARGMLFLFFSSLQTSVMGVLLAIVGFIFVYSMVFLIIKALFTYLAGYLGIAFLMIFAPLFIPLILFRKTHDYFDKWAKLVLSFALQPVIILVFICFTIMAVDLAMFSGDYSIMYRIAGEESRKKGFDLNKYLEDHKIVITKPAVAAEIKTSSVTPQLEDPDKGGLLKDAASSKCYEALTKDDPKLKEICAQSYPIQMWKKSIDWKAMAEARTNPPVESDDAEVKPEQQIAREVLAAVIFAGIVVFVMNGLLTVVPMVANDLVGESFQSPNLFKDIASKRARGLDGAIGGMSRGLGGLFGGNRGGGR